MSQIRRRHIGNNGARCPYITDGLIFHLDGADATQDKWIDRVGKVPFTLVNTSKTDDGGVRFTGSRSYGNYSNGLTFPVDNCTLEIVYDPKGVSVAQKFIFTPNTEGSIVCGVTNANVLIIRNSDSVNDKMYTLTGVHASHSVSFNKNRGVLDGNPMSVYNGTDYWNIRTGGTYIGCRTTGISNFAGVIYQIRVYNRILTEEEILFNQGIDFAKYLDSGLAIDVVPNRWIAHSDGSINTADYVFYTTPIFVKAGQTVGLDASVGAIMSALFIYDPVTQTRTSLKTGTGGTDINYYEYTAQNDCYVGISARIDRYVKLMIDGKHVKLNGYSYN